MTVPSTRARRLQSRIAAAVLALFIVVPGLAAAQEKGPKVELADVLGAMVMVRSEIAADARTAGSLGTRRVGSGVVIDAEGLVLTIGYLILEAERTELVIPSGDTVEAKVVGYDHDTGFGLLRAVRPLAVKPMRMGDSSDLAAGNPVVAVSIGPRPITPGIVIARRPYAGYWEYLLEDAILTSPPHPQFGGAALVGVDGLLLGIGSLYINVAAEGQEPLPGNMFVPIDRLKPILADLIESGRSAQPQRPWLGVTTAEAGGRVLVRRVSPGGPAEKAGLKAGDVIVGVGGKRVDGLADFLRKVWGQGGPGAAIPLDVLHLDTGDLAIQRYDVPSISRYDWLKMKRDL
ncbi:MAG: S1C family serine protease [Rhodospirillales bacterium]|nr:S1C family serine protease [Rhodospirillales bacterium]